MSIAFVFPGQGSQSVGMLGDMAAASAIVKDTFAEASSALGYDLWDLVANGPAEKLNETTVTQPAMLTSGVAMWRIWQDNNGAAPQFMAGHSLGEYTALVCADSIGFADAVKLVEDRGRFMQQAVPAGEGGMAAILGLDDDVVVGICDAQSNGDVLEAVNFNSPGQVVIAGKAEAVARAVDAAKEAGAKRALPLPVSVPSHCQLMKPAADQLAARLADINVNTPSVPVLHNADVVAYQDADKIRDALVRQLYSPVRWVETVQSMASDGVDKVIECGPGKVLAGLNKRIERSMAASPIFDPASLEKALSA